MSLRALTAKEKEHICLYNQISNALEEYHICITFLYVLFAIFHFGSLNFDHDPLVSLLLKCENLSAECLQELICHPTMHYGW